MSDRREALRRTYLRLGTGELAAAAAFAFLARVVVSPRLPDPDDVVALWAALVPLLAVLVQAGAYWLLARAWVATGAMPARTASAFRALRVVDVVLLLGGLGVALAFRPGSTAATLVVLAIWSFAVVEYVNYYLVRLAYPARRWPREVARWRRPQLVRDLRVAAGSS